MKGLTTSLFGRACRIFLTLAYPEGSDTIPAAKAFFLQLDPNQSVDSYLAPPICQPLPAVEGRGPGFALRLGSATYPHLKMQIIDCDQNGTWVFGVDTHDTLRLPPGHADTERWLALQAVNRRLKEQIEHAWEAQGLLTFTALLRRGLQPP
jgi:hypothetical protein